MTTAERLRQEGIQEGMQKGIQEGIQEGLKKGVLKTSTRLLTKRFGVLPNDIIEKIKKLDSDTLEILINDIFSYESLEDINKYLN